MNSLAISGENLHVDEVVQVAQGRSVSIASEAISKIQRARQAVETLVEKKEVVYGITTGFGHFKDRIIPPEQVEQLQLNLVRSHAVGVGPLLTPEEVRAMLLVRANTLAKGFSGVRQDVVELMIAMLNHKIHPRIPSQGSLGASGDLAPLAHLAMALIGEGEVIREDGSEEPAAEALARVGLKPLTLQAKEGLAILNGTSMMVGLGALLVRRGINLVVGADIAAGLTLEALHGTVRAYDERVHAARPHPRQIDCAGFLRRLVDGSQFLRRKDPLNVQDPYTLRCVPQVHGAVRDSIAYAQWVIDIELNAVNDNPIIFAEEDGGYDVISAGNFHGEPIAFAGDYMKLGVTELGNMSERRIARLVDADCNQSVLPMFLTEKGGLQSGFMIAQYTAAALASENKVLAHPASADSIPSSANTEDHVSMGSIAVRHLGKVVEHVETIVAIEMMAAAQGIDFRCKMMGLTPEALGKGTREAYLCIREEIPFLDEDPYFAPMLETMKKLVRSGKLKERVESVLGAAMARGEAS